MPVLSAKISVHPVKNKAGKTIAFKLSVKVTDAGDAIPGATVHAKGKKKKTNILGAAELKVTGKSGADLTVTITEPGYQELHAEITL